MKKTTFFYFGIAIALLFACDSSSTKVMTLDYPENNDLEAEWLLGEWKYEDENGALHEDWTKKNDTVYSGVSYFIEKKDTLFF